MSDETFKVTMRNVTLTADGETAVIDVTDYVPESILDVYVADARTRWQFVGVSDSPEDTPNGGEAVTPAHLEGKSVEDFAKYGDASTPENALDESLGD